MHEKTKALVEGAIMIALATVLSFITFDVWAWGGSVTLLSMLPICIYSLKRGIKPGLVCAFAYSLIQLLQGIMKGMLGWGLTPAMLIACIFLDYILAYTVLGLCGFVRKKNLSGCIVGILVSVMLRFICHILSGVIIWQSIGEVFPGFSTDNTWIYSLIYNGSYMLPEMVITIIGALILFKIPYTKNFISD